MVYIILPVYNEERNISPVIASLRKVLADTRHVIIAVNDGSSDGTAAKLSGLEGPDLSVIGTEMNMNVGAVFSLGIHTVLQHARPADAVIIMESDGTSEISLMPSMLERLNTGSDIVIASRYRPGGGYRNFPAQRYVFSILANNYMRRFFPLPGVSDYTIFFRAYRAAVLKKATEWFGPFGLIQSRGFVANVELLVKLSLFTERIGEIPFVYDYGEKNGASKLDVFRTVNEYFTVVSYLREVTGKWEKNVKSQSFDKAQDKRSKVKSMS